MQSFENSPLSPAKRLGVPLNIDTGYNRGNNREATPPQTPKAQIRSGTGNNAGRNRALKVGTGTRETFLDDSITPVDRALNKVMDADRAHQVNRDSHDLSISPRQVTRDSLVDHMLLSLDQFAFESDIERQPIVEEEKLYSGFGEEETYQVQHNFAPRNVRGPGHGYSYSSDYDNGDDSSRYSDKFSRGRRSNSSSNIQSVIGGRLNSLRNDPILSRPPVQIPPRGIHSRSGKGSKGSSANSFDLGYAQATNSQRWAHGLAGRSSSFDYGDRQSIHSTAQMSRQMNNSAAAFSPYDYDAAPTPTVPGGPRRARPASPIVIPQHDPPAEPAHKIERKRSTRSSKSAYKSKGGNGNADYGLHDRSRELPPLPAFQKEQPAPAPLVGYGKSKEQPSTPQSKERPGFFRRVFGSSRNASTVTPDPPRSHGSTTSAETGERSGSRHQHIASQIKQQHAPSPREAPPTPKEHTHVLTKKPSSFFRRRKKSVSEPEPPVPLPIVPPIRFQSEQEAGKTTHSPVSSLRKVMNPYLRSPAKSPLDPQHPQHNISSQVHDDPEGERHQRGFSPDYEPDLSATIRTVKPSSRDGSDANESPIMPERKPTAASSPGFLGYDDLAREDGPGTFLQDASDNDRDGQSTNSENINTPRDAAVRTRTGPTVPPPLSVSKDTAPVAEYGKVYSKHSPTTTRSEGDKVPQPVDSPVSVGSKSGRVKDPNVIKDEDWVMLTPTKRLEEAGKDNRVWLEPSSSNEDVNGAKLSPPGKDANASKTPSGSTESVYQSAASLPILQIEGENHESSPASRKLSMKEPSDINNRVGEASRKPSETDREQAKKIYDGNEDFVHKSKAATWLGEEGLDRARTLIAYMELYDFANINILVALRKLCSRLVLKAESQQVDRILDTFSHRWCQCNPNHGFKAIDVVHTICYSILLLNTDLHMADIDQKMTRSQFVKNTMPTIRRSVADSAPDAFESNRPSVLPGKSQTFDTDGSAMNKANDVASKPERKSLETERPSWRTSFKPPTRQGSDTLNGKSPTPLDYDSPVDDCGPLVKSPFHGTLRTWEVQVEIVLKDFYNSIRNDRLPLFGASGDKPQMLGQSSSTLSVFTNGMLRRSPSVLSKAPSESQSYIRGRTADTGRSGTGKWANKNRSRARLYPNSGMGSSRTSLDDQSSMWSPSVSSSTWSKYSLGKTHTSMSVESFGSSWGNSDYQQSIGFANALSQAIIREENPPGTSGLSSGEELRAAPLLEDESLELAGAPWAKEGILKHKHHLEALDKKAKDRNWNEVFAVVEKGYISLFSFSTKSMRNKSKGKASGRVVGGGNWQENAELLSQYQLQQTIASALPSPGYSKSRPHVWALSLPNGAVHLFQVGTPDIIKEFVSTANYWSARLSNHPLTGGVSNIEYGWSDSIVNNALVHAINESTERRPSTSAARPSMQSSLRSSLDQGYSSGGYSMRARLPGDRITIADWTPPTQSMRASNLMEPDQLRTLQTYVTSIENELQKHNQLRSPMLLAFTPRHPNSQKAMANWEKKSSYLLREIVKFSTYIDILQTAEASKARIYAERAAEKAAMAGDGEGEDSTLRP
ncbi:hypothetical protein B0O99DRAFT_594786 [Bisporella sp. PMI_857]|nr:hypothetical protein B0O99DRAFT_594786 [Bisporella sp. PMI_857]